MNIAQKKGANEALLSKISPEIRLSLAFGKMKNWDAVMEGLGHLRIPNMSF